jgi:hypothetical protein
MGHSGHIGHIGQIADRHRFLSILSGMAFAVPSRYSGGSDGAENILIWKYYEQEAPMQPG